MGLFLSPILNYATMQHLKKSYPPCVQIKGAVLNEEY